MSNTNFADELGDLLARGQDRSMDMLTNVRVYGVHRETLAALSEAVRERRDVLAGLDSLLRQIDKIQVLDERAAEMELAARLYDEATR